ncbi:unnamed protein product, partial [Rotaria magnacalcarata]
WRNFDDERVSSLSYDKELVRPDAYVLFYRHRNLPLNLTINEQTASPMPMDMYEDTVTMESSAMKDVRDFLQ